MSPTSPLSIEIRIDNSGEPYSIINGKIRNYEGKIKVDDLETFLKETISLPHPLKVVKFIIYELGVEKKRNVFA
jgi:hypothetical protein